MTILKSFEINQIKIIPELAISRTECFSGFTHFFITNKYMTVLVIRDCGICTFLLTNSNFYKIKYFTVRQKIIIFIIDISMTF